jgi:hypothetical protein
MTQPVSPLELPADRRMLVARLRQEIADGTYDTPERMERALDAFLDRQGNPPGPAAKERRGRSGSDDPLSR